MAGDRWTDAEIATVAELAGKVSILEIAEAIGKTKKSVRHRAASLGLWLSTKKDAPPKALIDVRSGKWHGGGYLFSEAEDDVIRKNAPSLLAREIGEILGRPHKTIIHRAMRLGVHLTLETTNTGIGRISEHHALDLLPGADLKTIESYAHPFDMEWRGSRINVKAAMARYAVPAGAWYWYFRTKGNGHENCDFFLCIGYRESYDRPYRAWMIPSSLGTGAAIGISVNGTRHKYVKYEIEVKQNVFTAHG